MRHESSAYKNRFDFTAGGISLTEITGNNGPKIETCVTPHNIFP